MTASVPPRPPEFFAAKRADYKMQRRRRRRIKRISNANCVGNEGNRLIKGILKFFAYPRRTFALFEYVRASIKGWIEAALS